MISDSGLRIFYTICLVFGIAASANAKHEDEKVVQANDPEQITDPVLITNISVAGKSIECGLFVKPAVVQPITPFTASDDWLKQMTISLINRTEKTIAAGTVTLMFPDNTDCRTQPCALEQIRLGQLPEIDRYNGRTGKPLKLVHPERQPLDWAPGQTIPVRVGEYIDEIESNLSNYEAISEVRKVAVHIGPFYFNDGMKWFGVYSTPDPRHPGKFKDLSGNYFPGRRGHNWPAGYNN